MEKGYIKGIIGALLGGLIASIPWIICYVYGNMILSLLAIIIAMGALKGYQIFKGKEDSKLPLIISVITIFVVIFVTLLVIPGLMLNNEGFEVSLHNFKLLYQSSDFIAAMVKDTIISVIFAILGITGVVSNIKKNVKKEEIKEIESSI